jgi:hypothetical protein
MDPVTLSPETVGGLALAVVMAVSSLLRAVIPAKKMPKWLGALLDLAAGNWGHAKNAEPQP